MFSVCPVFQVIKIKSYFFFTFSGSFGVHAVMNISENYTNAFYGKLGFVENTQDVIKGKIVMGRTF